MHFRRALPQHIPGQQLARKGRWLGGKALLLSGYFSRHIAGGIVPALDGKKRLAVRAVKEKDESLLRGLRDRIHLFAVPFYRQQDRRRGKVALPKILAHSLEMPDAFAR